MIEAPSLGQKHQAKMLASLVLLSQSCLQQTAVSRVMACKLLQVAGIQPLHL